MWCSRLLSPLGSSALRFVYRPKTILDTLNDAAQAVLGDEIDVPTLDGDVKMKVRPGTQPGQRYKLRGKGIPRRAGPRGDQIVRVDLHVPTELSESQRELVESLAEDLGVHVKPQQRTLLGRLRRALSG